MEVTFKNKDWMLPSFEEHSFDWAKKNRPREKVWIFLGKDSQRVEIKDLVAKEEPTK